MPDSHQGVVSCYARALYVLLWIRFPCPRRQIRQLPIFILSLWHSSNFSSPKLLQQPGPFRDGRADTPYPPFQRLVDSPQTYQDLHTARTAAPPANQSPLNVRLYVGFSTTIAAATLSTPCLCSCHRAIHEERHSRSSKAHCSCHCAVHEEEHICSSNAHCSSGRGTSRGFTPMSSSSIRQSD